MYGAILGDIIGSPFEFDMGDKTKKFELFTRGCGFTDDSVMTIAVAEALIAVGPDADEKEIEEAVIANMQDWGKHYPHAEYGGRSMMERTIRVTGKGKLSVKPDMIRLRINIEAEYVERK